MVVKPANLLGQYLRKNASSSKYGVVVSAGKMAKAVKVRVMGQEYNKHIRKYFPSPKTYKVADPNSSLVEGDVIKFASGWRTSKEIHHVVTAIVGPFGRGVEERPPVLTTEQLMEKRLQQRLEKDVRSKQAGRLTSIWRLKEARAAGYEIPDLEIAMRNVRLREAEAEAKRKKEAGATQQSVAATSKDRRRMRRENAELKELKAQKSAKKTDTQTGSQKAEKKVEAIAT